jgi:uncharacterized protein (DUF58 family)
MKRVLVLGVVLLWSAPTLAQDMMGPALPGAAPQICRWITPNKNSAQQERVCKTAAQWQQFEREADETARREAKEKERKKN